jgi:biotin transport system substrate-specific component
MSHEHLSKRQIALSAGFFRAVTIVALGSVLIAASARLQVPFWPVPMTLQTFAVLFLALVLGPRLGTACVALYLFQGAVGLPVFASGGGAAHLVGPTGGYLFGFLCAAALAGHLAQRGWALEPLKAGIAALAAGAVIFAFGVAWLSAIVGTETALKAGLLPFLPGEVVKIALLALTVPAAGRFAARALER